MSLTCDAIYYMASKDFLPDYCTLVTIFESTNILSIQKNQAMMTQQGSGVLFCFCFQNGY